MICKLAGSGGSSRPTSLAVSITAPNRTGALAQSGRRTRYGPGIFPALQDRVPIRPRLSFYAARTWAELQRGPGPDLRGAPAQLKGANLVGGHPWVEAQRALHRPRWPAAPRGEGDASVHPAAFDRRNGSPGLVTRFPELLGVRDRPLFDPTATPRNRGPEDIARHAALVTSAEARAFGPHQLRPPSRRPVTRWYTDPGLVPKNRKGTGFYRVPSLRGVWYRSAFEHSGSVATLRDWFDPLRLREDCVPAGWKGPGVWARAVRGHDFGLDLSPADRAALITFLNAR